MDNEIISNFIQIAKINQENLWKRRQIEWKSSLSLWAALGIATGYFIKCPPCPVINQPYNWIFLIGLILIYITVLLIQRRHIRAHFISNERDLDSINYYFRKISHLIDDINFPTDPEIPEWIKLNSMEWGKIISEKDYYKQHKDKMRHSWTPIVITALIEIISVCIFASLYIIKV
jgi:hypothetical protein